MFSQDYFEHAYVVWREKGETLIVTCAIRMSDSPKHEI